MEAEQTDGRIGPRLENGSRSHRLVFRSHVGPAVDWWSESRWDLGMCDNKIKGGPSALPGLMAAPTTFGPDPRRDRERKNLDSNARSKLVFDTAWKLTAEQSVWKAALPCGSLPGPSDGAGCEQAPVAACKDGHWTAGGQALRGHRSQPEPAPAKSSTCSGCPPAYQCLVTSATRSLTPTQQQRKTHPCKTTSFPVNSGQTTSFWPFTFLQEPFRTQESREAPFFLNFRIKPITPHNRKHDHRGECSLPPIRWWSARTWGSPSVQVSLDAITASPLRGPGPRAPGSADADARWLLFLLHCRTRC